MEALLNNPQNIGLGAIAIGILWVFWKVLMRFLDIQEKETQAKIQLAQSQGKVADALKSVEATSKATAETVKHSNDTFSAILTHLLKDK